MAPVPSPTKTWHSTTYPSLSPSRPELSAQGKSVLITGGGTGIGAETARYFAAAGASRIALLGRRLQPLLDTKASIADQFADRGVDVFVAAADVTKKGDVDAAFAQFAGGGRNIDVLVSGAAKIGPQAALADVDPDELADATRDNLRGTAYVAQAFLRHAARDAVVVDVNSSVAHANYDPKFAAYSVAKLAVFRLWDYLAFSYPHVRVFHIHPGLVDTDMNRESGGVPSAEMQDHVSLPASFIVWLASPEARFLRGKFLWANWDVDELKARAAEMEKSPLLTIGLNGWPFGEEANGKVAGKSP